MSVKTETLHAGGYIVSEAENHRSRDTITIESGQGKLVAGTVLGKKSTGKYVASTVAAADGAETASAILFDAVDATSADVKGVAHVRACQVRGADLTYAADVDLAAEKTAKIASLKAAGIIVR